MTRSRIGNQRPLSFFIPALNGGGAQKVVVNLANAMIDLTERPIHLVLARAEGEFLDQVRPEVTIVDLRCGRALRAIPALARYMRETRPKVLCSSLNYANVCATIAWMIARKPCRLVLREDSVVRPPNGSALARIRGRIRHQLMASLYSKSHAVVAISNAVAQTLEQQNICKSDKIRIIGNPVNMSVAQSSLTSRPARKVGWQTNYIAAVGRLAEAKGFDVLIRAFSKIDRGDLDLVIVGEGPLRPELERLIADYGLAGRVHLPGFVPNPGPIVAGAKLFVLSSNWEGFGNVLVEALAAGTPVVSTDCLGGPCEILCDGEYGHLVPISNPSKLAQGIGSALLLPRSTPEDRKMRAMDFDTPVIARRYLEDAFDN